MSPMKKTKEKVPQTKNHLPELSLSRVYEIIRRPIVSEKTTGLSEMNQQVFEVSLDATKPEIKVAIETLFKVRVQAVNTLRVKGKTKRFRGREGKRKDIKKAYVTLHKDDNIDIMAGI